MEITIKYCDRCNCEIKEYKPKILYLILGVNYVYEFSTNMGNVSSRRKTKEKESKELCQSCYKSFLDWYNMKNKIK